MSVKPPTIQSLSSNPTPQELRKAIDEVRLWFQRMGSAGGVATGNAVGAAANSVPADVQQVITKVVRIASSGDTHALSTHAPTNADNTAINETSHADVLVDGDIGATVAAFDHGDHGLADHTATQHGTTVEEQTDITTAVDHAASAHALPPTLADAADGSAGGAIPIPYGHAELTLGSVDCTLSFTDVPSGRNVSRMTLILVSGSVVPVVTWPAGITPPVIEVSKTHWFDLATIDNGTTWRLLSAIAF
jgi:hypothetical protein